MNKPTPGPWTMFRDPARVDRILICAPDKTIVAKVTTAFDDAELISAAPEILAALKALYARIPGEDDGVDWWNAKNAIAKAEGRL